MPPSDQFGERIARILEGLGWTGGRVVDPAISIANKATGGSYWRSYSPLLLFLSTVNPAFLASEIEVGLSLMGELKLERTLRTGFLQAGHCVSGLALKGRSRVNFPPHTLQSPSHSSYS